MTAPIAKSTLAEQISVERIASALETIAYELKEKPVIQSEVMMERAREFSAQASLAAIPAATNFVLSQIDGSYMKPALNKAPLDENSTDEEKNSWMKLIQDTENRHTEVALFSERLICHLALNVAAGLTSRMFPNVIPPPKDETQPEPQESNS